MTGKSIACFLPTFATDENGKQYVSEPPEAGNEEYIMLALAAIVAHYTKNGEEPPITSDDILYDASPLEVTQLITTVVKARNEWYKIPEVVQEKLDAEKAEQPEPTGPGEKNA